MDAVLALSRVDPAFRADVLAGLAAPIKAIPARWFYDRRGSELFEEITRLPEYYPTRTDTAPARAPQRRGRGDHGHRRRGGRVRLGLLGQDPDPAPRGEALPPMCRSTSAAISCGIPPRRCRRSSRTCRSTRSRPTSCSSIALPAAVRPARKLGFFPGSTIGNMVPRTAVDLLRAMKETLGEGACC